MNDTVDARDEMASVIDDEDWQRTVEDILEDGPHSTELGKMMGRDAVRVSIGEMSDQEFHEKYHDAVLEEFGEDNRPVASGGSEP